MKVSSQSYSPLNLEIPTILGISIAASAILKGGVSYLTKKTEEVAYGVITSPSTWQTLGKELCQFLWTPMLVGATITLICFCLKKCLNSKPIENKPEKKEKLIETPISEEERLKLLLAGQKNTTDSSKIIDSKVSNENEKNELDPNTKSDITKCFDLYNAVKSKNDYLKIEKELNDRLNSLLNTKELPGSHRKSLEHLQSNLSFLKHALEPRIDSVYCYPYSLNDKDNVIEVPSDGNCFFHSTCILLELRNQYSSPQHLRQSVCNYIQENVENDWILKTFVEDDISTFNEDLKNTYKSKVLSLKKLFIMEKTSEEMQPQFIDTLSREYGEASIHSIKEYIECSARDGFWSGTSHLYALSAVLKKPIQVTYNYNSATVPAYEDTLNPTESSEASLKVVHVNRNHFKPQI